MTFCHHTKAMTPKEIDEAFAALDRNSWEATCKCCGTYYTGVFPEKGKPDHACPKCKYDRNGIGSPAGGMNLLYRMDV